MNSTRRQRLIRVLAVIAIAVGAGHVAQSNNQPKVRFASLIPGFGASGAEARTTAAVPDIAWQQPVLEPIDLVKLPAKDAQPEVPRIAHLAPPVPAQPQAELDCIPRLSLAGTAGAMIDVQLVAPCRPDARVVLRHAGLAVAYRTDDVGALSVSLPALTGNATVSILFAGGDAVEATLALPEAERQQRFGVQWMGSQALSVIAFENGADFGTPGQISAAYPNAPADTFSPRNGFLTVLGQDQVENPMLAEIYTFPAGAEDIPVIVEVGVTEATCGREILGETIAVAHGSVRTADLSVTMPGCDAKGDYLVLKNLVPDLKLASTN